MAQKFAARERRTFSNGAIGWAPGGPMDCLGPYAKVENCPIKGTNLRRTCYATGYADTYFSVPAETRVKGKRITGFFTQVDGAVEFNPMSHHLPLPGFEPNPHDAVVPRNYRELLAAARKLTPTKAHRLGLWEAMLGTLYAMNKAGEAKYFDYDRDKAFAFLGKVCDVRVARFNRWTMHSGASVEVSQGHRFPNQGQWVWFVKDKESE